LEAFKVVGCSDDDNGDDNATKSKRDGDESACPLNRQCMRGSDGLPLKLLRCGHVFDQTCWEEWSQSGQGDVTQCPICRSDVGKPVTAALVSVEGDRDTLLPTSSHTYRNNRYMQRYMDERCFRLQRLQRRYPAYVCPQQVTRWTQNSYDLPLATDQTFVERDPARQHSSQDGSSSFSNSSQSGFGGGASGGGRGGRW
jgi:uncharacterized membrane protein YgcG